MGRCLDLLIPAAPRQSCKGKLIFALVDLTALNYAVRLNKHLLFKTHSNL